MPDVNFTADSVTFFMSARRTPEEIMAQFSRPRILVADDHELIAEAFTKLLSGEFEVVAVVHDGRKLLETALAVYPDVVLVDVGMPLMNGLQAAKRIKRDLPNVKIIFVTINSDSAVIKEALREGASGYLLKTAAAHELVFAIRESLAGRQYVSPQLAVVDDCSSDEAHHLTDRQIEVLQLLAEGKSLKEVAGVLNLTTRTVAFHKSCLKRSLKLKNDAEVVRFAVDRHITFE
jgi:DNA-binding NarL/FixJ family response regulator